MATIANSPLTDQEAWQLLPWLVTDRLEEAELHRLLDHLKESPASRRELRYLSDLGHLLELDQEEASQPDPEPALTQLMARIDESEQAARSTAPWHQRLAEFLGLHRRQAFARLAQAACLTLVVAWLWPKQFHTMSSDQAKPAAGQLLTLVFHPQPLEQDVRRLLLEANAEIVAGPTPRGVYTAAIEGSDPESILAELRRDPAVALAEASAGSLAVTP